MNKNALRKKYHTLRNQLSVDEIEEKSLSIANQALKLPIWDRTIYHIFLPIAAKKEVNTEYLLHILQGKDKSILVPKADFSNGSMTHYLLQENTSFEVSTYGIAEPVDGITVTPNQIDVVFVPLLAYDTHGNRVGYGKGFYDAFLAQCPKTTIIVGLSFFSPEANVPSEYLDIPLQYCITPQKIYSF